MIKFLSDSLSHFKKTYKYPNDCTIFIQYTNIYELVASLKAGDVVVFDTRHIGANSMESSLLINTMYQAGVNVLVDFEPLISSARMKIVDYHDTTGSPIYDIETDDNLRNTLASYSWIMFMPFVDVKERFFIKNSDWYWDYTMGIIDCKGAENALREIATCHNIDVPSLRDAMELYEKSSDYFKYLEDNLQMVITTPIRDADYEFLTKTILDHRNSGINEEVFYTLQSNYNIGVVDTWRLIYGYVHLGLDKKLIAEHPKMDGSHIMVCLKNIYKTLSEKYIKYSGFSIHHSTEFWHQKGKCLCKKIQLLQHAM